MIRIAIIDDNLDFMDELEKKCNIYFYLNSKKNFIKKINPINYSIDQIIELTLDFDILFLDVEMPNFSGIEIGQKIRSNNKKMFICFITNFSEYAIDSYSVHAFDYILKPINQEKINRFFDDLLAHFLKIKEKKYNKFHTDVGIINVPIDDVLYFEYLERSFNYKNRIVLMHLTNKRTYAIDKKISMIFSELDHSVFVVPHKSFIVNLDCIRIIKTDKIILNNGVEIPLSQKRRQYIKGQLSNYLDMKI